MKKSAKRLNYIYIIVVLIVSAFLSIVPVYIEGTTSTSPCSVAPGCKPDQAMEIPGRLVERKFGYPIVYSETSTYFADDPVKAGYASASYGPDERQFNWSIILVNIVFWYALIDLVIRIVRSAWSRYGKRFK